MKSYIPLFLLALAILSCKKSEDKNPEKSSGCDMAKVYAANELKHTITSGIWGTIAFMEGNCMPIIDPATTTCKTCPAKRTVRIYEYTLLSQATPSTGSFFDSFSTKLVRELETDNDGFYQVALPAGKYTIVTMENGKLHADGLDGVGGINPVDFTGGLLKLNLTMHYKAVF